MTQFHQVPPIRVVFLTAIVCLGSLYLFGSPTQVAIATTACVFGFCATKRDAHKRLPQDQSLQWW